MGARGGEARREWDARLKGASPAIQPEFTRRIAGEAPKRLGATIRAMKKKAVAEMPKVATRRASEMVLEAVNPVMPETLGGSADLTGSNLTRAKGAVTVTPGRVSGNYISWGVREFGMSAAINGMALHGGFIPYDATFLVFSDYARNAVRMSALIPAHAIHVYTHDSIGLGEDGPTHQPIEHLASLRYIPNNRVWRPCDAVESAVSWKSAIERRNGPSCLVFSRQNLQHQQRNAEQLADIARGGYVLSDPNDATFKAILIATGSEVGLAMDAMRTLELQGVRVRVVSMPCTEQFDAQPAEYREGVLPSWCRARVAIEAAHPDFWRKYVGLDGDVVGIASFGASAPADKLFAHFGFSVERIVDAVKARI
jgi:transketolase